MRSDGWLAGEREDDMDELDEPAEDENEACGGGG